VTWGLSALSEEGGEQDGRASLEVTIVDAMVLSWSDLSTEGRPYLRRLASKQA
jgi:hypothetical protein